LAQKALINLKHTNPLNIALIFPFTIEADFGVAVRFIGFPASFTGYLPD